MGFFKQTWFGIKKEFAVYKNNPRSLVIKSISLVISVVLTIITGRQNQDNLATALTTNALWHIIVFYMPARVTLEKVSHERETSFKEYLMVNGMSKAAYQAKIATSNYIEVLWYAISQSISIYVGYYQYLTSAIDIVQIFFIVFFGGTATINMALYFSTLMEPQNASSIGSMIILILGLLYYVGTAFESIYAYIAFSFHPTAGLALAVNSLIAQNYPTIWDGYTGYLGLIILACSSVYYLALYLYNERDRDADSKTAKKRQAKQTTDRHISLPLIDDAGSISSVRDIESQAQDYTSAIHYEKLLELGPRVKTIEASHLTKQFPECTAVNDISFSIYEREIFCLLGHNGAGKTTLVSLLTGLIPKTDGSFFYNGEEVFSNLDKIRGSIGFCPQKDYLLMENTVYENLSFFAEIKEIPADRMEAEIERVMNKLGLETFKDMPAKKLSGGFKRKLNVGIALLNDPKIIIMDEPTSGMDPVSRRNFWNIIKGLKNELKTVVLTTQFIDEAEELADRVAIMAKGKLFAVGSSDFIKKKFGTGYNLTIQDSNNSVDIKNRAKELFAKIQSIIPSATQHFNTSATTLQFTLPFQDQSKFSALFTELERISDLQINLQMVSLEEAFVSLGLNAEKALQTSNESENQENSAYQTRVPSSFFRERKPTFKDQLGALLLLRWYKVLKNKRFMFFASFPLIFVFAGVGVGNNTSDPQTGFALFLTLLITGNAFLMNTFAIPPITERLTKITYVLKAMGLQSLPYWLGNLIVDFIVKVIFSLLIFAAIYIFNVGYLQEIIGPLVGIYLAFSFYMIIYSYTISLVFDSVPAIMVASPSLFLAGAFLPSVLAAIVDGVFNVQSMMVFGIISFIFFGPAMILQFGVTALVSETYQSPQYGPHLPFQQYWAYIIVSIGMGILYFILLTYIESRTYELKDKKIYKENEEDDAFTEIEQEDVVREKERLASPFNKHAIKAVEVQKVYPNGFKALHDLTFGVEKNQIFCLLGPNGAGKTTSFEIVTATIPKTKGLVEIGGKELSRSNAEIFQEIGMCSQSNTLWDFLTVEHHLRIYARLKGMDKTETDEAVEYLQNLLQLTEYTNRGADKLSGGNKRKLCVAISMIGAPKYIFLDEPSTGMDPLARNYLWTLIKDVMKEKQGSMVLTTHYMQEAELVADKLGILVNGRFATIGSLQELKKKFGEYTIAIYETEGGYSKNQIEELVRSVLPEVKQRSGSDERGVTFKVSPQLMKFGQLFFKLEETKSEGKIKDFSIFTTTLEQIFIKLAKHQRRLTES